MKKTILFLAAFAALVSCVKENPVTENPADETPSIETCSISLEASAPASSDAEDTKTTLIDDRLVHWTNGDAIKVLFFPRYGVDGVNATVNGASGTLASTFAEATAASARFETNSWSWGTSSQDNMSTGIALYPSSAVAVCNKANSAWGTLTKDIHYELPSVQTADEGTFQSGINFAYAQISSKEEFSSSTATLSFQNACALIKVTLPEGVDNVTSVEVVSANGSLAGTYEVGSWSGAIPTYPLEMSATSGSPSVTLSAPEGQTLKAGVPYYIVVWPGTHSDITFNFTNTEGLVATKSVGKEVTFVAAKYNSYKIKNDLSFEAAVGDYYFADGTTGDNPTGRDVVGVVFYKGNPNLAMSDTSLPDAYSRGLAISLDETKPMWNSTTIQAGDPLQLASGKNTCSFGGYTAKSYWEQSSVQPSVYQDLQQFGDLPADKTSGWYLATNVEWTEIASKVKEINSLLKNVNGTELSTGSSNSYGNGGGYWLPYTNNMGKPFAFVFTTLESTAYMIYEYYNYENYMKLRPIFAF